MDSVENHGKSPACFCISKVVKNFGEQGSAHHNSVAHWIRCSAFGTGVIHYLCSRLPGAWTVS